MWHDSQWLPRFASWTESGRKRVVSLVSESWISPLLDHPRSANISLFALLALSRDSTVSPFSSRASSSLARFSSTGNANTGLIGLIRSCPTLGIFLPVYQKVSFFAPKSDKFLLSPRWLFFRDIKQSTKSIYGISSRSCSNKLRFTPRVFQLAPPVQPLCSFRCFPFLLRLWDQSR